MLEVLPTSHIPSHHRIVGSPPEEEVIKDNTPRVYGCKRMEAPAGELENLGTQKYWQMPNKRTIGFENT